MDGVVRSKHEMRKRALVAGGAGFLGAHLCRRLIADGYDVIVLDSLVTGRLSNLGDLPSGRRLRFIRHDVTRRYDASVDVVFNLACCASPVHCARDVPCVLDCKLDVASSSLLSSRGFKTAHGKLPSKLKRAVSLAHTDSKSLQSNPV